MSSISAASASSLSHAQLGQEVSVRVAKKTLDAAKANGEAAISLLESAAEVQQSSIRAEPHKGNLIDVRG